MSRNADVHSKTKVGGVGSPIKARQETPKRMPEGAAAEDNVIQKRKHGRNGRWRRAQTAPRTEKLANGSLEKTKKLLRQRLPSDAERTQRNAYEKETSTSAPLQKVTKTLCFTICSHTASL